ncbi:precorrin-6A reductase [Paenibacillus aceris]|uniref:Precorrin-6A/cobalt-precorrin-6A reductase n=1 Tax=Paenibacillus aceris TaxID=869555 RepID=A0ABS4HTW1_9BACL|nr:precorrin-6A reductase [Paenibacillus aceris]MBP1962072.1 precorrin-6A/cobalt-precorrin-6A reductase [Paenibacillus aceris]NHW34079.1 precorrin-6A reductase [Paenibacillus aceris]
MILVLAGTSDARELALRIRSAGYDVLTTVVTESAAKSMEAEALPVLTGRLTAEAMKGLIIEKAVRVVVDATHPFAEEASKNAMAAAQLAEVPYVRFERQRLSIEQSALITTVEDYKQAAELAATKRGNIMLTTGSKTLKIFTDRLIGLADTRLVARMLPRQDNMEKCEELGIEQKNIVAMQGPFSKELNKALYDHYKVTLMITKESGKVGAVDEKLEAALEMGIPSIVIGRPQLEYGTHYSDYEEVIQYINNTILEEA